MDYYTADRLYRYTNSSNLSEPILNYVASRINWGDKVSLMTLAKEIQSKFNDSYVKENTECYKLIWKIVFILAILMFNI